MKSWLLLLTFALALPLPAAAQTLTLADRQGSKSFTIQQLLADPAAKSVSIQNDIAYKKPMTYRAIPLDALLKRLKVGDNDYVQARATDNFSIGIPARLMTGGAPSGIEAFLAIEEPGKKWPLLPGKKTSAGPFYLVWRAKNARDVSSEYWTYMLAALSVVDSPAKRWPGLGVAASVPATDPVRRGLDRYVAVCIACHKFNGEGEGEQGPDLGRPMNPVDYFQLPALKKLLRDPASVRTWSEHKMPAFDPDTLSDDDIDAIVAWLAYKARK